ncbi:DUF2975 domain-containing protein [Microbacterium sp. MEC084]|uniref:DUF2975 domain-containing protein n=1 Tax=Microbacterium sp. MEC084 TaxID=1963027 RepID=UPI00106FF4B8|nr:DUF2975 domain-containing protein [Microbacterium sp. MEC084]MCD1268858.1 DUF2975 domain-containing protein [Microbacterium sp. MEC084]
MGRYVVLASQFVIALSLAGSLVVQTVILPLVWIDLEGEALWGRVALVTIAALWILGLQVCAVCVWRLLGMVRRGSVFSRRAFRWVDVIIAAIAFDAVITFVLAVLLAPGDVAPGVVALVCGAALVTGGVALLVAVMRQLLQQAIDRDAEARALRSELDEVI